MLSRQIAYDAAAYTTYTQLNDHLNAYLAQRDDVSRDLTALQTKLDQLSTIIDTTTGELTTARLAGQQIHISVLPLDVLRLIYGNVNSKAAQYTWSQVCKLFCKIHCERNVRAKLNRSDLRFTPLDFVRYANSCYISIEADLSKDSRTAANKIIDNINRVLLRTNGFAHVAVATGDHNTTQRNMVVVPKLQLRTTTLLQQIDRYALQTIVDLPNIMISDLCYWNDGKSTWLFPNLRHLFVALKFETRVNRCRQIVVGAPRYLVCNRAALLTILYVRLYFPNTIFVLTDDHERLCSKSSTVDVNYQLIRNNSQQTLFQFYKLISAYAGPKYPQLRVAATITHDIYHALNLHLFTIFISAKIGVASKHIIYREFFDDHCKALLAEVTTNHANCQVIKNDGRHEEFSEKLTNLYVSINWANSKLTDAKCYQRDELAATCEYCIKPIPCSCYPCNACQRSTNFTACDHSAKCATCCGQINEPASDDDIFSDDYD